MRRWWAALCLVLLGCAAAAPRESSAGRAPSAAAPSDPVEEPPPSEGPPEEPEPTAEPPSPPADPALAALDPTPGAIEIVARTALGDREYVLYRYDGVPAAQARILSQPDGQLVLEAIEAYGCDQNERAHIYPCFVEVYPDPYLVAWEVCGLRARGWGVAVIDAADHTVRASRWLFAASCDRGNDMRPSLSVSDPDADGRPELLVEHAVRPIRRDLFDGGSETGMLKYVLDAETLRTQLALMTDVLRHEGSGDHTECYGDFDLVDLDGDPHPDVEVEVACESRRAARERERPRRRTHRRRCRYRADVDAWASCDVAQWLFPGHDATGIAVETPADLRAAMPGLGSETAAVVELYRRQIEREAEE